MLKKNFILTFIQFVLVCLASVLVIAGIVKAGSLTPSASPAATFYTLTDIYNRLTTNATNTEANHNFSPSASPAATLYTLKQIYEAIPDIATTTVKLGTSYLGVTGTLTPDGGTAAVADVFSSKTAHLTGDWNLDTGTLVLACATSSFDGTDNLVSTAYDGAGDGTNRWCMTDTGDATVGNILSGKIAWVDGAAITGTMTNVGQQTITPSTSNTTITTGYHDGTGYCEGDSDLVVGNIKTGTAIFGVTGTYSGYPGTGWTANGSGDGSTALSETNCDDAANWYWFDDVNADGDETDPEDGMCVLDTETTSNSWNGAEQVNTNKLGSQGSPESATGGTSDSVTDSAASYTTDAYKNQAIKIQAGTAAGCWGRVKTNNATTITVYGGWLQPDYGSNCGTPDNTSTFFVEDEWNQYDNSWIGDWACEGNFPDGTVDFNNYPTSGTVALATSDCYDGKRDLLAATTSRGVVSGTATAADATSVTDSSLSLTSNVWVGQMVYITSGTGADSYGFIESNGTTTITVTDWLIGADPAVNSGFSIIYIVPHASYQPALDLDGGNDDELANNGPLTPEALRDWKGTRLPTSNDFYGFCGYKDGDTQCYETSCSSNKQHGNYGSMIGRTDECLDLSNSSWEWLSELHHADRARVAGDFACSYFYSDRVHSGYRFRAVFRP